MKNTWRQDYTTPENNNTYPQGSYWLLGDQIAPNGYTEDSYVLNTTTDEKWMNCKDACEDCNICRKANPFYQNCWRSCDRCRTCHLRNHRSLKTRDPPYWNRHPYAPDPNLSEASINIQHPMSRFTTTNVCGPVMYQEFINRYSNYVQCQKCQSHGKCWSRYQQKCVDCDEGHLAKSCEIKFGCPNPMGPMFPYVPPRDPLMTDCRPCWQSGYTTL